MRVQEKILIPQSFLKKPREGQKKQGLYSYDTYQFTDYSKYNCDMFDEEHKREVRDTQFPKDMESAFELGKRLVNFSTKYSF